MGIGGVMELPRKLDARDEEAKPFLSQGTIAVFLDGVEQRDVESYDMDAGEIVCLMRDEKGQIVYKGADFTTETLKGAVTVRFEPRP
jgi:hypothetical protein